jgi:6-pyruvoyltetrahydropterin/6-carboxytetrahydropterin synthase
VSLAALDALAREAILEPFDRRDLNLEVPEMKSLVPTTENLAEVLAGRVAGLWRRHFEGSRVTFEKLRVWETARNIFQVSAPEVSSCR